MVNELLNPIIIIIVALATGFLLPIVDKKNKSFTVVLFFMALIWIGLIALNGVVNFSSGAVAVEVITAGISPPFSINLQFGLFESVIILATTLIAIMTAWLMLDQLKENVSTLVLFLIWVMGIDGMIMTRDIFNLFIFIEITAICSFVLTGFNHNSNALSAGFKAIIAGTLASSFFLLGVMFLYYQTGTLNIDDMVNNQSLITGVIGHAALVMVLTGVLIELKPYPINGWALDVYQSAPSGIAAMMSVSVSAAYLFVFYKLLPLFQAWVPMITLIAGLTFVVSNFIGLKQTVVKRLLGYSSVAQIALIIMAITLLNGKVSVSLLALITGGLFLNHLLAKSALFWLAGMLNKTHVAQWTNLKKSPVVLFLFGCLLAALVGLPPFPAFWAKWELMMQLATHQQHGWMLLVLLGSLLEAVYLLRWFSGSLNDVKDEESSSPIRINTVTLWLSTVALFVSGFTISHLMGVSITPLFAPILAALFLLLFDELTGKTKAGITCVIAVFYSYDILLHLTGINWIFGLMLLMGSCVFILGSMYRDEQRRGYFPLLLLLIMSLGTLLQAKTSLNFFYGWELMTMSSYLLMNCGKNALKSSFIYLIFSMGAAYFILFAFALVFAQTGTIQLDAMNTISQYQTLIFACFMIGFLIKLGGLGFHVWLPGVYSETEDDYTAILSGVVSKVGVFGLLMAGTHLGQTINDEMVFYVLGWLGVITALLGALMAVFQEDVKKLLAYSSIGQMGYIVACFALMNHLGWVTAMYLSVNHLLYKGLIFLAIAGVIYRTQTTLMYKMGGLLKNMPMSFFSALIGIIAISGVPPLLGFGGKWMLYNAMIEKGWYFQAGMAFFASAIAFLYLFRFIHTVFLGQRKSEHKELVEAPFSLLIPQVLLIIAIMVFSLNAKWLIQPLSDAVAVYYPSTLTWTGTFLQTSQGYWDGYLVMNVVTGVFLLPLIILLLVSTTTK
ncbi:MAG: proton-conducting membrane transporter, partial [Methylococcales bacterium]|nr:proton-conducting membrane transporter [Methylococcales bacterium]